MYKGICTGIFITIYFKIAKPEIYRRRINKGMVALAVNVTYGTNHIHPEQ